MTKLKEPDWWAALWVAAPLLRHTAEPDSGMQVPVRLRAKRNMYKLCGLWRTKFSYRVDEQGRFAIWFTLNQKRNLSPFFTLQPEHRDVMWGTHRLERTRVPKAVVEAAINLCELEQVSDRSIHDIKNLLILSKALLASTHALIDRFQPRSLMLASQHNLAGRALLWSSQRSGVPTIYIPHAPTALNASYRDLPFSCALLRGEADREFYEAIGADSKRLFVIGDPSLEDPVESRPHNGGTPTIIVAPSNWALTQVEWFMKGVQQATGTILVTPHPGSDLDDLRSVLSPTAELLVGVRSIDVIGQAPCVVIQCRSGVGLEALSLGVPVIEFRQADQGPLYLYSETELIPVASNSEELQLALAQCINDLDNDRPRREYARRFIAHSGEKARRAGQDYLNFPVDCDDWALDSWGQKISKIRF